MIFAAKRLTRSDLTLFEAQYRTINAGAQKSINLNRRVFVDLIFPGAAARAAGKAAKFPVVLRIFGPNGIVTPHQVTRKVIAAGGSQKNWRLNGEFIRDPDDGSHPGRYNDLRESDLAVMGFDGEEVPTSIDMVVISQAAPADASIASELARILGTKAMAMLSSRNLEALVAVAPTGHPLAELVDPEGDEVLEEAALGSVVAIRTLRRRSVRRQSAEDLIAARLRASAIGRNGEVLVAGHLRRLVSENKIEDFVWESEINAVNPWDITIRLNGGELRRLEVKSTSGPHGRGFHISQAELEVAVETGAPRTEIWRVCDLDDEGGNLRRSTNFRALARSICDQLAIFGAGIVPDGWTIDPALLEWSESKALTFDEDPEE